MLDLVPGARRLDQPKPVSAGFVSGLGQDFDDIARVKLVPQRNHPPIDLGSNAGVPHFCVDRVRKVNWGGVPRQHHHFPLGGKRINLFGIEIDF